MATASSPWRSARIGAKPSGSENALSSSSARDLSCSGQLHRLEPGARGTSWNGTMRGASSMPIHSAALEHWAISRLPFTSNEETTGGQQTSTPRSCEEATRESSDCLDNPHRLGRFDDVWFLLS